MVPHSNEIFFESGRAVSILIPLMKICVQYEAVRQADKSAIQAAQTREAEWKTYLECSPLPDPRVDAELNTFLSIFEHETVRVVNQTADSVSV